MKQISVTFICVLLLVQGFNTQDDYFDYLGDGSDWAELGECSGSEQSPVNIDTGGSMWAGHGDGEYQDELGEIFMGSGDGWVDVSVEDDGHAVVVHLDDGVVGAALTDEFGNNHHYDGVEIRFHAPAEHTFDGHRAPLEMQVYMMDHSREFGMEEGFEEYMEYKYNEECPPEDNGEHRFGAVLSFFFEEGELDYDENGETSVDFITHMQDTLDWYTRGLVSDESGEADMEDGGFIQVKVLKKGKGKNMDKKFWGFDDDEEQEPETDQETSEHPVLAKTETEAGTEVEAEATTETEVVQDDEVEEEVVEDDGPEGVETTLNFARFFGDLDSMNIVYTYHGSLTTPPCLELVNWYVFQQTSTASQAQLDWFSNLWVNPLFNSQMDEGNNRQQQDLGDRTVYGGVVGFSTEYSLPLRNSGEPAWDLIDDFTIEAMHGDIPDDLNYEDGEDHDYDHELLLLKQKVHKHK